VPVSTTTSPVTVAAEVAVKPACSQPIGATVAHGVISNVVPSSINAAWAKSSNRGGLNHPRGESPSWYIRGESWGLHGFIKI